MVARELVGVWAFAVGLARHSVLPIRILTAPPFLHGYAATPVIDRSCLDETLDAMLDWIAATASAEDHRARSDGDGRPDL